MATGCCSSFWDVGDLLFLAYFIISYVTFGLVGEVDLNDFCFGGEAFDFLTKGFL